MINLEINWSKTKCTHSPELIKKRYQKGWTIFQIVLILHMDAKSLTMDFWGCCFCFVSIFPFYLQEQHFFFLSGGLICTSGPLDFFKSCYGFMFFFLTAVYIPMNPEDPDEISFISKNSVVLIYMLLWMWIWVLTVYTIKKSSDVFVSNLHTYFIWDL